MSRLRGAREEGIEKGKEEGRKEGYKQVAINLLKDKVDIEIIKKATGLTSEEIDKLKKEI